MWGFAPHNEKVNGKTPGTGQRKKEVCLPPLNPLLGAMISQVWDVIKQKKKTAGFYSLPPLYLFKHHTVHGYSAASEPLFAPLGISEGYPPCSALQLAPFAV